ncbi:hypothetical protein [Leptospira haakeii]|uniref:Uncharacterized protein n=1 Tax=Leptospira haakeii TaxID=2023198 RepID=A0ABX4PGV7_9LEPT|nr:hypothetical protein [Leptospira haakeii]PKA14860.1 hypothetical protein CH363_16765 [Leptospira haakeii]PKA18134.1 hypothetical protein CH377_19195 [Leptospira haakeii]
MILAHTLQIRPEIFAYLYIIFKIPINFWIAGYYKKYYESKKENRTLQSVILSIFDFSFFIILSFLLNHSNEYEIGVTALSYFLIKIISLSISVFLLNPSESIDKKSGLDRASSIVIGLLASTAGDMIISVPAFTAAFLYSIS